MPAVYQFPAVQYEILEDLFLIDEEEEEAEANGRTAYSASLLELEDEALRITGNWEPREDDAGNARKKIRPKGRIRVWNTETNAWEGMEGVKVRTNRWFKWGHGWTDRSGNYRINKRYKRDIRYSVRFENRAGFKIWNTLIDINTAKHNRGGFLNGKKYSRSGWDKDFGTGEKAWRFCTVNNAVVKYFRYCDQFHIGKPHGNLRISALNRTGSSAAPMLRRTWGMYGFTTKSKLANFFLKANGLSVASNVLAVLTKFTQPDLVIVAKNSRGTANIYGTIFHELGHASHMRKVGSSYWVKYVNYIITYGAYGNGKGKNAGYCGVGEMWGNYLSAVYMNQERPFGGGPGDYLDEREGWYSPGFLLDVDNIPDVTTAEVFSCLTSGTNSFDRLISQIKTKTNDDSSVDAAYSNYTDWP